MNEFTACEIRAKNLLIVAFSIFVLGDIVMTFATQDYIIGITRVFLTIALMYFVLAGFKWAKWLMVGLFVLNGTVAYLLFLSLLNQSLNWSVLFFSAGLFCSVSAVFSIFNKNINNYFIRRRGSRNL